MPKAHRDDGELLHHRLVDELVGEDVVARRVVDHDRRVAHDRREVLKGHGEDPLSAADADCPKVPLALAAYNAVDVLSALESETVARFPIGESSGIPFLVEDKPTLARRIGKHRMQVVPRARLRSQLRLVSTSALTLQTDNLDAGNCLRALDALCSLAFRVPSSVAAEAPRPRRPTPERVARRSSATTAAPTTSRSCASSADFWPFPISPATRTISGATPSISWE